jgi:class 3 adenylate cyclase
VSKVADNAHRRLRELAEQLDCHRWAAELVDEQWRLVWVSEELLAMRGDDEAQLPYGQHFLKRGTDGFSVLAESSRESWLRTNVPFILHGPDGDRDALVEMLGSDFAAVVGEVEAQTPPPRWISAFDFARGEFFGRASYMGECVHDEHGELIGYLFLYTPALPARLLSLLVRGQRSLYERMAQLLEASSRPAAILFGDLEASSALARRLPTAGYFSLIRSLRTRFDAAVADHGGIVGKHAGDGVTAFFLAEQVGSQSAAARAALETARGLGDVTAALEACLGEDGLPLEKVDCRLNVAIHWDAHLYIGQVATEGRLEVTALGAAVNEAARIEQSARGGRIVATKALLERLCDEDASDLGIDPERMTYEALADLEDLPEKVARDAGAVAVTDLTSTWQN